MNNKKIALFLSVVFVAVALVYFLWKNPALLIVLLLVLAYIKHKIFSIKKELLMFVITGVVASLAESTVMYGGPWSYTEEHFLNFPIWLPFLWGLAGTSGITLYQGLTSKK